MLLRGQKGIPGNIHITPSTATEMKLGRLLFKNKTGDTPSRNALTARAITFYVKFLERATTEEIQKEHEAFLELSKNNFKVNRPTGLKYRKKEA